MLHRATDVALRTHQHEKRRALHNAIVSAASPTPPDVDKQAFFLRLIDELTINQIVVLAFYADPMGWFMRRGRESQKYYSASRSDALAQSYPEISGHLYVKELVLGDLRNRGLLGSYDRMVTGGAVYDPIVTKLALEFLAYVRMEDSVPSPT